MHWDLEWRNNLLGTTKKHVLEVLGEPDCETSDGWLEYGTRSVNSDSETRYDVHIQNDKVDKCEIFEDS
jgi:hypothetical protein